MGQAEELFEGEVRDLTSDGHGVVEHPTGRIFFVPGVWPSEQGKFRVTEIKSSFGRAECVQLDRPSEFRVAPPCSHHGFTAGLCGGCPWQFISYPAQVEAKEYRVKKELNKFGLEIETKPIWRAPEIFGYRNRASLKTDGQVLGYVTSGSRTIAAVDDCPILNEKTRQHLLELLASLPRNDFRPGRGALWTNVHIDDSINYNDIKPGQRLPFRQANDLQNNRIREWLEEKIAGLGRDKAVLELFCGSGNFTELLSCHGFNNILCVDMSPDAVGSLRMKDLPGVRCLVANLYEKQAYGRIGKEMNTPEVMLFDPPRDGLRRRKEILSLALKTSDIFYISCDPATFGRDVREFVVQGFEPVEVQPLDMFPHTPHVEILAHLHKAKS